NRVFVRESDGLVRVRPEINDYRHHATAYLRHDVPLTPDLRRRFLIGWQLMDQWGPMLVNRFFSGFMNMPEQLSINFCPSADWGRSATRETDISIYETVWRATIEKNPKRTPFWTSVYYDPGAKAWMVSHVSPADYKGRFVATGGQDVEIADLIMRTIASRVEKGTWNFIVDDKLNLIAHPNLTEKILEAGSNLNVNQLKDDKLKSMVDAVLASHITAAHAIEPPGLDVFLGVSRISGPGWYMVTVYPKHLLTSQALSTARVFLAVGFTSLLIELVIMAIILRRRIAVPIANTVTATERISRGDFSVRLDPQRNDELGLLAESVNRMAKAVGDRDAALLRQFKELEQAKQIQQEQQRLESIGTLAGGIAHDFNNILSAIIGYTDVALRKGIEDEKWRDNLHKVLEASDRAAALVRQILALSRKQQQERRPLQLSPLIKEALKLLRASIPSTIEIRQEIISQAYVLADPTQIHQVIMNLCTNAYQAMMETGGVLSITLKEITSELVKITDGPALPDGCYVVLSVSDTGQGITKGIMDRIFEPYFTTKEQGKGTGLGLAVARGIVESHNGLITVGSQPGKGATFSVYLPVITCEQVKDDGKKQQSVIVTKGQGRIMVVDDEVSLQDMVRQLLTHAGYQVDVFTNGMEAWQAIFRGARYWDLLLTDQTMPGMTGSELALKVLEIRPNMPVIICSGYGITLDHEKLKKAGVFACVDKPLNGDTILSRIAQALSAKSIGGNNSSA
ncbi:MAG: ATP-binding protein, partial [Nitrospirota bacterium]